MDHVVASRENLNFENLNTTNLKPAENARGLERCKVPRPWSELLQSACRRHRRRRRRRGDGRAVVLLARRRARRLRLPARGAAALPFPLSESRMLSKYVCKYTEGCVEGCMRDYGCLPPVRKTPSSPRNWADFSLLYYYSCILPGMYGQTCIFWANLTPCSLCLRCGGGKRRRARRASPTPLAPGAGPRPPGLFFLATAVAVASAASPGVGFCVCVCRRLARRC
jgi:hypothetical protein